MFTEAIPTHAEGPLRAFDEAMVDIRTRRLRLEAVVIPDVPGPTPKDLERAATQPDAPAPLRAMARAVAEGRATWDDVLAGRLDAAPEVQELFAASRGRFAELWERGVQEDERLAAEAEEKRRG